MREILFKAIAKEAGNFNKKGDWVYGFPVLFEMVTPSMVTKFGEVYVDPETVCQFTGLRDCEGERIFNGDQYNTSRRPDSIRTVYFCEESAKFKGRRGEIIDDETGEHEYEFDLPCQGDAQRFGIRLIGKNIHDRRPALSAGGEK